MKLRRDDACLNFMNHMLDVSWCLRLGGRLGVWNGPASELGEQNIQVLQ